MKGFQFLRARIEAGSHCAQGSRAPRTGRWALQKNAPQSVVESLEVKEPPFKAQ